MKASARLLVVLLAPLLAVQPAGPASAATTALQGATTGSISGTVTAANGGGGLANVIVEVLKPNGNFVTEAFTANDGTYVVSGISASTNNIVCFDAQNATGGSSTTGYADQCWQNVAWDGSFTPPASATQVAVTGGVTTTGVNGALTADGGIGGKVTAASGGAALKNVTVDIFDRTGLYAGSATTNVNGVYKVVGLAPDLTGYSVCFDAESATGGSSVAGYESQCWQNVAWDGNFSPPGNATPVPVSAGAVASNINGSLPSAGGITGTVKAAADSSGLSDVDVDVYDGGGNFVTSANTNATGHYKVIGLNPGTYKLCFDAGNAAGGPSTTGYVNQCYKNVSFSLPPPGNAKAVTVSGGVVTTAINASLVAAGGVSGTVTAAVGGGALNGVYVKVLDNAANNIGSATTNASGVYSITDVPPSASGYVVCFDARFATGGSSTTGYASQCYQNVPWDGFTIPQGTTPVAVSAGSVTTNVNAGLSANSAISGTVTAANGGAGVKSVDVRVFDNAGGYVDSTTTNVSGAYSVVGLAPSATGYTVCFDAANATGGSSTTGYASQCYNNVAWGGGFLPPQGTTLVPVAAGQNVTNINAALTANAAVSGTVTAAAGGGALKNVTVQVYAKNGIPVKTAQTALDGTYKVTGLAPSSDGYIVCFDPSLATGGSSTTGYNAQCWQNIPWDGFQPPVGATAVPTTAGNTATNVNAALSASGAVAGVVTATTGGAALSGVEVRVYTPIGFPAGDATTNAQGRYRINGVTPANNYIVCFNASNAAGGSSTTGYSSECYKNKTWDGVSQPPAGVTAVVVQSGVVTSAINAALESAGAIGGTITADAGGAPLQYVQVEVVNASGFPVGSAYTAADGTYVVKGLATASDYTECFRADAASGGTSTTGYASECYQDVPWSGAAILEAGTTPVSVTAGSTTTIDAQLLNASGIAGTVTAKADGKPLGNVTVAVFDGFGNQVTILTTGPDGKYIVRDLSPSSTGYTACFDASKATGGTSATGFASQCYDNLAWAGLFVPPPDGTTPIAVSPGKTNTIDVQLANAGAIAGAVTATSGGTPLAGVSVDVFDKTGTQLAKATTGADGSYIVTGLPAAPVGDIVCFDTTTNSFFNTVTPPTGYASECHNDVAWAGGNYAPLPAGATTVPIAKTTATVNAALAASGTIAGKVTNASDNSPVQYATVHVFDNNGNAVETTPTGVDGSYSAVNLASGSYKVCVDQFSGFSGFPGQCFNNVVWSNTAGLWAGGAPAPGATPVVVTSGTTTNNIDFSLPAPTVQQIAGTVSATTGGAPLANAMVDVFDSDGSLIGSAPTDSSGAYSVPVPPSPSGDFVCFDGTAASGGTSTAGYRGECHNNQPWIAGGGLPTGLTAVPVAVGATATVNAALDTAGGIKGKVTAANGGAPLGSVMADVFDTAGNRVASVPTQNTGLWAVTGLAPGQYGVCFDASSATGGASAAGYLGQCYQGVGWNGGAPALGTKGVAVAAGAFTGGIGAALNDGGAITGAVTTGSGDGVGAVAVDVFDVDGNLVATANTLSDGTYRIDGLPPSTTNLVCFDPSHAFGGGTATYAGQCRTGVAWLTGSPPSAATAPVTTTAGATTNGVNAQLAVAGAISGTVTALTGGAALTGVRVEAFDSSGNHDDAVTANNGTFTIGGLPAGSYTVCFDGTYATGGPSTSGYLGQCANNVAWGGVNSPRPNGTTPIAATSGATTSGVNALLGNAGSISGAVTAASGGANLENVFATVFDASGNLVGGSPTAADGTYQVKGLATATYKVCFDALDAAGGASSTGYVSRCYQTATWNSYAKPPVGAADVAVTAGANTASISVAVPSAGSIAGTVKAATGGAKLANVSVVVFDSTPTIVGSATTAANGTYTVGGLDASAGGYTVCFDATGATKAGFGARYASQCFNNVAWAVSGPPPGGTTAVPVSAGAQSGNVNANLATAAPATADPPPGTLVRLDTETRSIHVSDGARPDADGTRGGAAAIQPAGSNGSCDPDDLPGGSEGPDDDGDECIFTVTAEHPFPHGGDDQAETASGASCDADKQAEYTAYAKDVIGKLEYYADTDVAQVFLQAWLDGSGLPLMIGPGSQLSEDAKGSKAFKDFDNKIQSMAKARWDAGEQDANLGDQGTVSWYGTQNSYLNPDLFFSFGGTQGMKVDGSATWNHGHYVGNITYVITDTYGWNSLGTGVPFWNDFRPKMHWLQSHCGAPAVKGGPHWFQSGVTIKVPIR